MVGSTFTYLLGSDAATLLFNSKNEDLNAEDVYSRLTTPVFGKGVAYDVPNPVIKFILCNLSTYLIDFYAQADSRFSIAYFYTHFQLTILDKVCRLHPVVKNKLLKINQAEHS